MRVQIQIPEHKIDAGVLDAALEAVTLLDESLIETGEAPLFHDAKHLVRWHPEPPGQEHFDHAGTVVKRGKGDCDDMAPWAAASLRLTGEDPGATARVYQSGPQRWHAVVQLSDGGIYDPSIETGMPTRDGASRAPVSLPVGPAVVGSYILRPKIALVPRYGQWTGRLDIPWHWDEQAEHADPGPAEWAMSTLHTSPVASTALTGAILGGLQLAEHAEAADADHVERLMAVCCCAEGAQWDDLVDQFGEHHAAAATAVVGAIYGTLREAMGLHRYY